ncbi:MAG: cytochrome c biogenesis protein CcsA [Gemmatimonadetes bacterium]|nr:cytochrome c biogenesis protein CcsA [Gemmatimonadota bacterium]
MGTGFDAARVLRPRGLQFFGWFALLFFLASQAGGLLLTPPDRDMGHLQKIMYVHVPSAWMSLLAYAIVFGFGVMFLWKRDLKWDLMAAATAEAGIVFTGLALLTGSIWGRPTWGIWWTWDARLTSEAVLFIMYAGYLALRAMTDDEMRRARWSAAIAALGFLNTYIVYMSVRWWRTLHQIQSSPSTVDPQYVLFLRLNAFAFLFILIWFAASRYRVARLTRDIEESVEERALRPQTEGVHV